MRPYWNINAAITTLILSLSKDIARDRNELQDGTNQ